MLETVDAALLGWAPPLARIVLWAIVSGIASMWIYKKLSPQGRLHALKAEHKALRRQLKTYDGEWDGLQALIKQDLGMSMRELRMITLPVFISIAPVVALMFFLPELYTGEYLSFGPEWMRSFEFVYLVALLAVSLFIKFKFKIA